MRIILCIIAAGLAFGQSQSEIKVIPKQDDSATGLIRFQEKYANGANYIGLRGPASVTTSKEFTLPSADGTSGQCLQTDGSGQWGWAACIINGGNTTGATLTIGTNDAQTLSLETNGTGRWSIPITGHLYAGANNTYDIGAGLAANSPRTVYAATSIVSAAGDFAPSGGTGNYVSTRKLNIVDTSGGAGFWDIQAAASFVGNSQFKLRDNGGGRLIEADRAVSGVRVNNIGLFGSLIPRQRATGSGDDVSDSVNPDLGSSSARWENIYGGALDLTGNISAGIINATGSPAYRVSGTTVINASREATFTGLTITTGATTGYVLTDSGSGVATWQAPATPTAPLTLTLGASGYSEPLRVSNSTTGVYGSCVALASTDSVGSTIYVAGRLCGRYDSASFTDETVTLQTAAGVGAYDVAISAKNQAVTMPGTLDVTGNISGAVINATGSPAYRVAGTTVINASRAATFTDLTINTASAPTVGYVWTATSTGGAGSWQAAGGGSSLPVVDTTGIAKGSSDATKIVRFEVDGFTSGVTNVLTPQNNSYTLAGTNIAQTFSSTQTFSGTLVVSGTVGDDFIPNSNGTYVNGTTSFRWGSIATYNADFNGVLTLQSGSTITGSILPTTNNLYALGNTSYRMSNVATVNMNLSGTVTAPNGNTGLSSTRTVGDGSGGSCTITISGGIITASTCP